jgi:hypothetical protein
VLIAKPLKFAARELGVRTFRLLETENVGLMVLEITADKADPEADGIDIPSRDCEPQGELLPDCGAE